MRYTCFANATTIQQKLHPFMRCSPLRNHGNIEHTMEFSWELFKKEFKTMYQIAGNMQLIYNLPNWYSINHEHNFYSIFIFCYNHNSKLNQPLHTFRRYALFKKIISPMHMQNSSHVFHLVYVNLFSTYSNKALHDIKLVLQHFWKVYGETKNSLLNLISQTLVSPICCMPTSKILRKQKKKPVSKCFKFPANIPPPCPACAGNRAKSFIPSNKKKATYSI